jgi:mono/diheme cytochrome c family protein
MRTLIATLGLLFFVAVSAAPVSAAEVAVDAPAEVTVGQEVVVAAVITNDGSAVVDGEAALDTERMRVEYLGPDGLENTEFEVVVVDGPQLYKSDAGADLPLLNVWWIVVVLGIVWVLIALATSKLLRVGAASDLPAGPRRFIPRLMVAFVIFTALGMLVVVLTKPESHANLSPNDDFSRTPVAVVGVEDDYIGLSADSSAGQRADLDGQELFVRSGCASCHGVDGSGAVVGESIAGDDAPRSVGDLIDEVREGPKGMPAISEDVLSDEEVARIFEYLEAQ